jgi:formylglycine-generating enzyme required for sulfatase activity/beta-lactamase regulating signal transducer with metallopeptidase domain
MNPMIASWNRAASVWWSWTLHSTWQGVVLLAVVFAALLLLRRAAPNWRHGLLLLVLVKFLLPPLGVNGLSLYDFLADAAWKTNRESEPLNLFRERLNRFEDFGAVLVEDTIEPHSATVTPKPPPPPHSLFSDLTPAGLAMGAQAAGVLFFAGFVVTQMQRLRRRMSGARECESGDLHSLAVSIAVDLGLRDMPRIFLHETARSPQVGGILRPFVLLPAWVEVAGREDQRALLAHELAHLKRYDPVCNWFQILAQVWLWWNPVVWWLNSRIRAERELCCDDLVLSLRFASGGDYSRVLVDIAGRCARSGEAALEAMGMADSFRRTKERVVRALDGKVKRRVGLSVVSLLALAVIALLVLPGGLGGMRTAALVARTQGELRSLGTAILDYQTALVSAKRLTPDRAPVFRFGRVDEVYTQLTSPLEVITSIPRDPFDPEKKPYLVASDNFSQLLLIALGPNGRLDVTPDEIKQVFEDHTILSRARYDWPYSPTNGTYSGGDILHYMQAEFVEPGQGGRLPPYNVPDIVVRAIEKKNPQPPGIETRDFLAKILQTKSGITAPKYCKLRITKGGHYEFSRANAEGPIHIHLNEIPGLSDRPDLLLWADEIRWHKEIESGTATGNIAIDDQLRYRVETTDIEYDQSKGGFFFPHEARIIQRMPGGATNELKVQSATVTFSATGILSIKASQASSLPQAPSEIKGGTDPQQTGSVHGRETIWKGQAPATNSPKSNAAVPLQRISRPPEIASQDQIVVDFRWLTTPPIPDRDFAYWMNLFQLLGFNEHSANDFSKNPNLPEKAEVASRPPNEAGLADLMGKDSSLKINARPKIRLVPSRQGKIFIGQAIPYAANAPVGSTIPIVSSLPVESVDVGLSAVVAATKTFDGHIDLDLFLSRTVAKERTNVRNPQTGALEPSGKPVIEESKASHRLQVENGGTVAIWMPTLRGETRALFVLATAKLIPPEVQEGAAGSGKSDSSKGIGAGSSESTGLPETPPPLPDLHFDSPGLYPLWRPYGLSFLGWRKLYLCAGVINDSTQTRVVKADFYEGKPGEGGIVIGQVAEWVPGGKDVPKIVTNGPNGGKIERVGTELPKQPKVRLLQVEWDAQPGDHEVYCVLDANNGVAERNESNNIAHRWVHVLSQNEAKKSETETKSVRQDSSTKNQEIIDAYNRGNLDAILPYLTDPDEVMVRQQAILTLGKGYGDKPRKLEHMERIEKLLFSPSHVDRGAAASALMSREDEFFHRNHETILLMATQDPDPRVREIVSGNLKLKEGGKGAEARSSGNAAEETQRQQTGSVHGRVRIGEMAAAGARVIFDRYGPQGELPEGTSSWDTPIRTSRDGSFRVENLPPGKYRFSRMMMWELQAADGGGATSMGTGTHGVRVEVRPGETSEVTIGGAGRRVEGRLVPEPSTDGEQIQLGSLEARYFTLVEDKADGFGGHVLVMDIHDDGTFAIPDVKPGRYNTHLTYRESMNARDREVVVTPASFDIPSPTPGHEEGPYDVGEARVSLAEKAINDSSVIALDLGGGVKLEMVLIPAGHFKMGSEKGGDDEKPVHEVRIDKPFYIGKYEVTQNQWETVMGNNPSSFKGPKLPVESVSWGDCQGFLTKLSEKVKGAGFRLPSEAEWEYACRAGSSTEYCYGDGEAGLGEFGWFTGNSEQTTHPTGEKKPNAWGLYDMHGNVWEWCQDGFYGSYHGAPDNGSAWDSQACSQRVFRGGGALDFVYYCRSAIRRNGAPTIRLNARLGFRLARTP